MSATDALCMHAVLVGVDTRNREDVLYVCQREREGERVCSKREKKVRNGVTRLCFHDMAHDASRLYVRMN